MPEWITSGRRDVFSPGAAGEEPSLHINWDDGSLTKLKGNEALANYGGPEGVKFRNENPIDAERLKVRGPNDPRFTWAHKAGLALRNAIMDPDTAYHRMLNNGALTGGAAGGAAGLLGGILANWISDAATDGLGFGPRSVDYRLVGPALGAAIGAYAGHKHASNPLEKSSAMFVDPRNFILEKLQSANDVSASDKVKLAAAIRRMDRMQADRLAKQLRSVLGFSVGAVIARALGMSLGGALFGGIVGLMGSGLLSSMRNQQANRARMFL